MFGGTAAADIPGVHGGTAAWWYFQITSGVPLKSESKLPHPGAAVSVRSVGGHKAEKDLWVFFISCCFMGNSKFMLKLQPNLQYLHPNVNGLNINYKQHKSLLSKTSKSDKNVNV